jgi:hypothetical protein
VLMKGKEWTQNGLRSQALQRWNAQILCYEWHYKHPSVQRQEKSTFKSNVIEA